MEQVDADHFLLTQQMVMTSSHPLWFFFDGRELHVWPNPRCNGYLICTVEGYVSDQPRRWRTARLIEALELARRNIVDELSRQG